MSFGAAGSKPKALEMHWVDLRLREVEPTLVGCMKVAAAWSEAAIDAAARCSHQNVCVEIERFVSGFGE